MPAPLTTPGEILDQISAQKPEEIVITTLLRDGSDDAITRQALKRRSDGMNQALRDAGIRPGDFVPIHLPLAPIFWSQRLRCSKPAAHRCRSVTDYQTVN